MKGWVFGAKVKYPLVDLRVAFLGHPEFQERRFPVASVPLSSWPGPKQSSQM